jgi:hypothetical protein
MPISLELKVVTFTPTQTIRSRLVRPKRYAISYTIMTLQLSHSSTSFSCFRVHPDVANQVSHHLQEVMDAVKMRDCSKFFCGRRYTFPAPAA